MKYIKKFNESFFGDTEAYVNTTIADSPVIILDFNNLSNSELGDIYYVAINQSTDGDFMEHREFINPIPCTVFAIQMPEATDLSVAIDIFSDRNEDDITDFENNMHLGVDVVATELSGHKFKLHTSENLDIAPFIGEF